MPTFWVEVTEHWSGEVEAKSEAEVKEMALEITPAEMGLDLDSEDVWVLEER